LLSPVWREEILANIWEQHQLPHLHGKFVMFALVSKCACHATAARRDDFYFIAKSAQKFCCRRLPYRETVVCGRLGFLVAMAVQVDLWVCYFGFAIFAGGRPG
jgi:hypothetical protein